MFFSAGAKAFNVGEKKKKKIREGISNNYMKQETENFL